MHQCPSKALLELSTDKEYLGAKPGILRVLNTWGQEMNFHPPIHCIVTSGGLTPVGQFVKSSPLGHQC
jgi:hypothetical protein